METLFRPYGRMYINDVTQFLTPHRHSYYSPSILSQNYLPPFVPLEYDVIFGRAFQTVFFSGSEIYI